MANTVETLARSCGAHVYCAQKYKYLSIEVQRPARTLEQRTRPSGNIIICSRHEIPNIDAYIDGVS